MLGLETDPGLVCAATPGASIRKHRNPPSRTTRRWGVNDRNRKSRPIMPPQKRTNPWDRILKGGGTCLVK
jgi:hypothetical protein